LCVINVIIRYHGGTALIPEDMHLFIDGVVVAKERIGCMAGQVCLDFGEIHLCFLIFHSIPM
jgi:hypothetical protein